MMMNSPLISVIIPSFNSAKTITACLDSIVSQTFDSYEAVVVDGASTDKTIDILEAYCKLHPAVRFISEKDHGIYDAMNKGIAMSKGKWLIFLGSDDELYDKNVFASVFGEALPQQLLMIYGKALVLPFHSVTPINATFDSVASANLCHQSIFYSLQVFAKWKYDVRYKVLADWDLNLRLFGRYFTRIRSIDVFICKYLNTGVSADWKDQQEYKVHFQNKRQLYFRYLPLLKIAKKIGRAMVRRLGAG